MTENISMYKTKIKIALLILLLLSSALYAQKPKLELGIGIGSLYYPNYIGSKSTQVLTLPIPYIRYRGEYFRIDEDGLSGKLFGIDGLRLDLSVSGSLPAKSDDNGIRKGMPDLDFTGEVGVNIIYNIFEKGVAKVEFELPIRAVLSSNFSNLRYQGVVSNPQLKYSLNYTEFEWTFRTGLMFANQEYNSYYYEVKEEYETPSRATYNARGGYSGFRNRIGMTYQKNSWWYGAFISHFNINNTVFKDSPLVETSSALYMGASIAYIF